MQGSRYSQLAIFATSSHVQIADGYVCRFSDHVEALSALYAKRDSHFLSFRLSRTLTFSLQSFRTLVHSLSSAWTSESYRRTCRMILVGGSGH